MPRGRDPLRLLTRARRNEALLAVLTWTLVRGLVLAAAVYFALGVVGAKGRFH